MAKNTGCKVVREFISQNAIASKGVNHEFTNKKMRIRTKLNLTFFIKHNGEFHGTCNY